MFPILKKYLIYIICFILFCGLPYAWAEPLNIIFLIGDGMGPEHIKAAGYYEYGSEGNFVFESFPYQAEMTTYSADSNITDSAASATAMATGFKVANGVISMDITDTADPCIINNNCIELYTLLEYFRDNGKSTGLVTTVPISNATPAAFGAHENSRLNYANIVEDYLSQTLPDVLLGSVELLGAGMTEGKADGTAPLNDIPPDIFASEIYTVVTDKTEMFALNTETATYVSGQFGSALLPYPKGQIPYEYDNLHGTTYPHLSEMALTALNILDNDPDGFFLMIESGLIDWAGHDNEVEPTALERNIFETIEFNNAVQKVVDWAQGRTDTLILVTADHETGGLNVTANNGQGNFPTVTWSTTGHTEVNVKIYAWGENADLVSGVMDNTDLFDVACRTGSISIIEDMILSGTSIDLTSIVNVTNADHLVYTVRESGSPTCIVDPNGTYIEAENYDAVTGIVDQGNNTTTLAYATDVNALGGAYLLSGGTFTPINDGYQVDYIMDFTGVTGSYQVWLRSYQSGADYMFWGLDGKWEGNLYNGNNYNNWDWGQEVWPHSDNPITISTEGEHTFHFWARDPDIKFDGFYITTGTEAPTDESHGVELDPSNCNTVLFSGNASAAQNVYTTGWTGGVKTLEVTGDDINCSMSLIVANDTFTFYIEECGNGVTDPGEQCDDGNTVGGDGCSADCLSDESCGNGVTDPGEQCDDGNTVGGDGCSADCLSDESCGNGVTDPGEQCDDGNTVGGDGCSADCLSDESCGNGVTDPGEQCDDGNTVGGDGCSADCLSDESCGNGVTDPGEQCDDGNTVGGDGCSADCLSDESCGNGVTDPGEQCDDGNTVGGDGCSADCLSDESCGNGVTDPGEQCDDGNTVGGDGCSADCLSDESCGNGVTDPGEQCDDGNTVGGDGCSADCLSDESCGNGVTDPGEQCDDGNTVGGDGCSADCLSDESCGNGVTDPGEQCDDGNTVGGDGCSADCLSDESCGNGVTDPGEQCDDGNTVGGDGCSADCLSDESCGNGVTDPGEQCDDGNTVGGDGCSADCLSDESCGNGVTDPGEQCDDGNTVGGDGCSADCLSDESCGNGVTDPGEQCDDGNTVGGDGCSADCLSDESCGNGVTDPGEQCDDGNTTPGDGCSATCQYEVITLTPDATSIPLGSTLGYIVTITNNTGSTLCFDYWSNVNLPNGSKFPLAGELLGPYHLCLAPSAVQTAHLTHGIPSSAPLGTYSYNAFVGPYPTVWGEAHFNFTVTVTQSSKGEVSTDWSVVENGFKD